MPPGPRRCGDLAAGCRGGFQAEVEGSSATHQTAGRCQRVLGRGVAPVRGSGRAIPHPRAPADDAERGMGGAPERGRACERVRDCR